MKNVYRWMAIGVFNAIVAFIALNLAAALILSLRDEAPADLNSQNDEFILRHRAALPSLHPGLSEQDIRQLLNESNGLRFEYSAFSQYREKAKAGRFVNISENGFRHGYRPQPWPPKREDLTVFVFGGSTAFGYGVADQDTIAAHLERVMSGNARNDVYVYNFGRGGYYSSQERIIFQKRLIEHAHPDVAVFIDGINEFDLKRNVDEPGYSPLLRSVFNRDFESKRFLISSLARKLPIIRLWEEWTGRSFLPASVPGEIPNEPLPDTIEDYERYLTNIRIDSAVGSEFGVKMLFVWQPAPEYGYDETGDPFTLERDRLARLPGYQHASSRRAELEAVPGFVWLADMQKDLGTLLYVDNVHYTANFNRLIAQAIAEKLHA